jgi:hypothetical protein
MGEHLDPVDGRPFCKIRNQCVLVLVTPPMVLLDPRQLHRYHAIARGWRRFSQARYLFHRFHLKKALEQAINLGLQLGFHIQFFLELITLFGGGDGNGRRDEWFTGQAALDLKIVKRFGHAVPTIIWARFANACMLQ